VPRKLDDEVVQLGRRRRRDLRRRLPGHSGQALYQMAVTRPERRAARAARPRDS
jgi:hypothetical protein